MRLTFRALAGAIGLVLFIVPAAAELEIISARGIASPKVGASLSDAAVLDVPGGGELKLMKHPDAATFVVKGPFKGTLQQYIDRCLGVFSWLWSECGAGEKGEPLPSGGTRGIKQ